MSEALHPERCWFRATLDGIGPCDGRLRKCHLIPKQTIKREVGRHAAWDHRVWVPGCGGVTGIGGHHGQFDSRQLRVARSLLPDVVEEFAVETGLGWFLDRTFGEAA